MKVKRLISILLSTILLISLAGCGIKSTDSIIPELEYNSSEDKVTDFYYRENSDWIYEHKLADYDVEIAEIDLNDSIMYYSLISRFTDNELGSLQKSDPLNKIYRYYNLLSNPRRYATGEFIISCIDRIFGSIYIENFLDLMKDDTLSLFNPFLRVSYTLSNGKYVPFITYDPLYSFDGTISDEHYSIMSKYYQDILAHYKFTPEEAKEIVESAINLDQSIRSNLSGRQYLAEYSYNYINTLDMKFDIIDTLKSTGYIIDNPKSNKEIAFCCPKGYIRWLNNNLNYDNLFSLESFYLLKLIEYTIEYNTPDIFDNYRNIYIKLGGGSCVEKTTPEVLAINGLFADNLDILEKYYADNFLEEYKISDSLFMADEIRTEYIELINDIPWLNKKQKKHLKDKLEGLKIHLGYHDDMNDLSDFKVNNNIIETAISLKKSNRSFMQKKIVEGKNIHYNRSFFQTNAFYSPYTNEIFLMDGYFASPSYSNESSYEERLALIGSVIAHEFGHSIDPSNISYDKNNNYTSLFEKNADEYLDFCDALCSLYSNTLTSCGNQMDGYKENGEIIADYLAMTVLIRLLDQKEDADYKTFFSTYAKMRAEKQRPELEKLMIAYDVHPPCKERVNLTLAQFDRFYQTYGVSPYCSYYIAKEDRIRLY